MKWFSKFGVAFIMVMTASVSNADSYEDGVLYISSVAVDNGAGGFINYEAELLLDPSIPAPPLTFTLISANPLDIVDTSGATFSDGELYLPSVSVPNGAGGYVEYEAELRFAPMSDSPSIMFTLLSANQK